MNWKGCVRTSVCTVRPPGQKIEPENSQIRRTRAKHPTETFGGVVQEAVLDYFKLLWKLF